MKKWLVFFGLFTLPLFAEAHNKGKAGSPTSKPSHPPTQKTRIGVAVASVIGKDLLRSTFIQISSLQQQDTDLFGSGENNLKRNFYPSFSLQRAISQAEKALLSKDTEITTEIGPASKRLGVVGMAGGISLDREPVDVLWPGTKAPYRWRPSPKGWYLSSGDDKMCFLGSGEKFALPAFLFARSTERDLITLSQRSAFHFAFAASPFHRVMLTHTDNLPGKFAPLGRGASARTWNISNYPHNNGIKITCSYGSLMVTQMPSLAFRFYSKLGSRNYPETPVEPWSFLLTAGQEIWMKKEYFQYIYHMRTLASLFDKNTTVNGAAIDSTALQGRAEAQWRQRVTPICAALAVRNEHLRSRVEHMRKIQNALWESLHKQKTLLGKITGNDDYKNIELLKLPAGCAYSWKYVPRRYGWSSRAVGSVRWSFICHGKTFSFPPPEEKKRPNKKTKQTLCLKFGQQNAGQNSTLR